MTHRFKATKIIHLLSATLQRAGAGAAVTRVLNWLARVAKQLAPAGTRLTRRQVRKGFDEIGSALGWACAGYMLATVLASNRNDTWNIIEAVAIAVPGGYLVGSSAIRILGWVITRFFPDDRMSNERYEALTAEFSAMGAKKAAKEWRASKIDALQAEFLRRECAEGRYLDAVMHARDRVFPYMLYGAWVLAWLIAGWANEWAVPLLPHIHWELGLYGMGVADWEVWGVRIVTLVLGLVVSFVLFIFLDLAVPQIITNLLEGKRPPLEA